MAKKRRRRDRERRRDDRAPQDGAARPAAPAAAGPEWRLPSPLARIAGVVLAIVTFVIAAFTIMNALTGDLAPLDAAIRLVVGVLLIALAIAIAALSIAPAFVRGLFVRS